MNNHLEFLFLNPASWFTSISHMTNGFEHTVLSDLQETLIVRKQLLHFLKTELTEEEVGQKRTFAKHA